MVNGANVSCACSRSPMGFSPHCHIGDGCVDVILVRHTSLFNNIRLLLRLSSKRKTLVRDRSRSLDRYILIFLYILRKEIVNRIINYGNFLVHQKINMHIKLLPETLQHSSH